MLADEGVHFPDPFPRETRDDMGRDECPLDFGELSPPPPPPPLLDRLEEEQSLEEEDLSPADDDALFDRPASPLVLLDDPGPIGESDDLCLLQSLAAFSL